MTSAHAQPEPGPAGLSSEWTASSSRLLLPVLVSVGLLISLISSLGAPLIPTIARTYDVSESAAQWSLTITLMAGAVSTPLLTRLGDGRHRRSILVGTLALAALGAVLAAVSTDFACLLVGRALQGTANGLLPIAMSIARDHLPPERVRRAVATLSITAAVGVGLGYPITGLIAKYLDFRAGYWFAAIFGAAAVVLAAVVVPADEGRSSSRVDPRGAFLLVVGFGAVLLAMSEGEPWGWDSGRVLGLFAGGIVLLAAWAWQELRSAHPVVDLRLMANRAVLAGNVTGLLAGIGMYLLLALVVRFVQTPESAGYGFGASVVVAGLVLIPFSAMTAVSSRIALRIEQWLGFRPVIPLGCLAFVASLMVFRFERAHLWELYLVMGLAGLGVGCAFAALPRLVLRSVPAAQTSSALGANQVVRFVGFAIGSALSATILDAYTHAPSLLPTAAGYDTAAVVGAGVWALAGAAAYLLPGRSFAAHAPAPAGARREALGLTVAVPEARRSQ